MANVSGTVAASFSITEYITSGVITQLPLPITISASAIPLSSVVYSNGTAAGQIDTPYGKSAGLNATTITIDMTSVTDLEGNSITFARARDFFLMNFDPTAGHDLKVYQGASNGWAPAAPSSSNPNWARANGGWVWFHDANSTGSGNGNVVTSTSKTIIIDAGANNVQGYYLIILGGSVA